MAVRSARVRNLICVALLVILAVAGVLWSLLFLRVARAPSVVATVTKVVDRRPLPDSWYYVEFQDDQEGLCRNAFVARSGKYSVGGQAVVRHTGCSDVRETSDRSWWRLYLQVLIPMLVAVAFVLVVWRWSDALGRLALRFGRPPPRSAPP